mgnify:FL=1
MRIKRKKMKGKRKRRTCFKSVVSLVLAIVITAYTLIADWSLPSKVSAQGATDRVTTFINLAKGQSIVDADGNELASLTDDELQFLGVYLSNFYIPFYTELGVEADNESTVDQMAKALTKNMDWSEDMAKILCDRIIGLSRSNNRELEFRVSVDYQDGTYIEVPHFSLNYYNFLRLMLGEYKAVFQGYTMCLVNMETKGWAGWNDANGFLRCYPFNFESDSKDIDKLEKEPFFKDQTYWDDTIARILKENRTKSDLNYGYFGYTDGDNFIPVFDCALNDRGEFTSSQCAFLNSLSSVNISQGYGFSFFDFTSDEISNASDLQAIFSGNESLSDEDMFKCSIYNVKMYVDCFGNIINKGYNHQYIAVPGCMNPYMWQAVGKDGKDLVYTTSKGTEVSIKAGEAYPVINFQSMTLAEQGNLMVTADGTKILSKFIDWLTNQGKTILDYISRPITRKKNSKLIDTNIMKTDLSERKTAVSEHSSGAIFAMMSNLKIKEQLDDIEQSETIAIEGAWDDDARIELSGNKIVKTRKVYPLRFVRGNGNFKLSSGIGASMSGGDPIADAAKQVTTSTAFYNCAMSAQRGFQSQDECDKTYFAACYRSSDSAYTKKTFVFWGDDSDNSVDGLINNGIGFSTDADDTTNKDRAFVSCWYTGGINNQINNPYNNRVFLTGMVVIDNLGVFNTDNGGSADYSAINIIPYINEEDLTTQESLKCLSNDPNNGFVNGFKNKTSGEMNTEINANEALITSTYTSYLIAGLYEDTDESRKATIGKLGYRLNKESFPTIENTKIAIPEEMVQEAQDSAIRNWIYYLLNPTKGLDYVRVLIKNKTQAVLVGWHNDMVGTNGVGATTGTTTYKSNVGFVTTPDLSELKWTNNLLTNYEKAIPYIILAILILMIFTYIAGILSLQRAFTSVVLFGVLLFVPVFAINKVVSVSNNITQKIYGDRFIYWAVVQQESYATALDEAATSESYENYLKSLYSLNSQTYSNQGGDSIVLKWQAPKKMASLVLTKKDNDLVSNLQDSKLVSWVLNKNTMSGQTFTEGESSYLFRSYTDLSNASRYMYNGFDKGNVTYTPNAIGGNSDFEAMYDKYKTQYSDAISAGYSNPNKNSGTDISNCLRIAAPISSKMYYTATKGSVTGINKLDTNTALGINQNMFNFSLAVFNNKALTFREVILQNKNTDDAGLEKYMHTYNADVTKLGIFEKHVASLAAYGVMSESPYYYFSWNLYDQGMSTSAGAQGGYKNLLLNSKDNFNYFYNNQGNGEMKDFMDMRSLFTVMIPYLKQGNDLVREFDETYGLFLYDGVPTEEGHWDDQGMKDSNGNATELYKKYWHNVTVARLYEIYTPWVDLMYDCDYAQETTVKALGKEYKIVDPLNPGCYPMERPMIFSRSEMADYGLTEADLTEVERRIIKTNDDMCKRMFELLNYVNFRDSTLNSAAAMECTFAFNIAFSDDGIFGDNINIYPQSFEINNFSYDAFLRFVLSNTTGEDMTGSSDFYLTVVQKSSTTTAIMLIINDIVSQYIFPGFKIFFLVVVFIAIIMMIVVTVGKMNPEQNSIKKLMVNIVLPLLGFLVVNISFAWVLSLFMGTGNNAVTQTDVSVIQTGDPVIAMLIMVALDVICMIAYFFMIRNVIKEIQSDYHLIKGFVGGVVQAVGGKVSSLGGNDSNSSSGGAGTGSVAEEGTGQMSDRAIQRGNSRAYENREEGKSKRINEAKRDLFKQNKDTSEKKRSEKEINDKIKEGSKHFENDSDSSSSADVDMKDTPDTIQEYNNLDNVDSGMDNMESGMDNMEQAMDNMDDAMDQVGNNPEM